MEILRKIIVVVVVIAAFSMIVDFFTSTDEAVNIGINVTECIPDTNPSNIGEPGPCEHAKNFPGEPHLCVRYTKRIFNTWMAWLGVIGLLLCPLMASYGYRAVAAYAVAFFIVLMIVTFGIVIPYRSLLSPAMKQSSLITKYTSLDEAREIIDKCEKIVREKNKGNLNIKQFTKELKKASKRLEKDSAKKQYLNKDSTVNKLLKYASNAKDDIELAMFEKERTRLYGKNERYTKAHDYVVDQITSDKTPLNEAFNKLTTPKEQGLFAYRAVHEYMD